jgi:hypothetical protein
MLRRPGMELNFAPAPAGKAQRLTAPRAAECRSRRAVLVVVV